MKLFKQARRLGLLVLGSLLPLTFAGTAPSPRRRPFRSGTPGSFAILAGSGITNVPDVRDQRRRRPQSDGGRLITGLGVRRGNRDDLRGRRAGLACFINNPGLLTTTKSDLVTAFDNAEAQTPTEDITGVNLAGQTLGAGVYNSTGDILISGPMPLTLNGGGNADSVFIFQAAARAEPDRRRRRPA